MSQNHWLIRLFSLLNDLGSFVNDPLAMDGRIYFRISLLVHWSTSLSLCHFHSNDYCRYIVSLKLQSVSLLSSFLRLFWLFWIPRILVQILGSLSDFCTQTHTHTQIQLGKWLEFCWLYRSIWGRICILTISLAIQTQMYFHLLKFYSTYFNDVLKFSVHKSHTSSVTCIPKYIDALLNGLFS